MSTTGKLCIFFTFLLLFYIHIYTYAKLLTFIACLRSSFTGVKLLLWFSE